MVGKHLISLLFLVDPCISPYESFYHGPSRIEVVFAESRPVGPGFIKATNFDLVLTVFFFVKNGGFVGLDFCLVAVFFLDVEIDPSIR
jgi:hypothetical protein